MKVSNMIGYVEGGKRKEFLEVGDFVSCIDGDGERNVYIISQIGEKVVSAVSVYDGNRYKHGVAVDNVRNITRGEILRILGYGLDQWTFLEKEEVLKNA